MAPICKAQVQVAESAKRAAWIGLADQPNVNRHHFTAAAQLTAGQRFAEAYLSLRPHRS